MTKHHRFGRIFMAAHISADDALGLDCERLKLIKCFRRGRASSKVEHRFHVGISDAFDRRAAIDPYERERSRHYLRSILAREGLTGEGAVFLTVGPPRLRLAVGELKKFDPEGLHRVLRTGLRKLKRKGFNVRCVSVFEVNRCHPIMGADWYEPHLHAVLWGAPAEAIRLAFKLRGRSDVTVRRRATQAKSVGDLDRLIGYMTKFCPRLHIEYLDPDGSPRWQPSRCGPADAAEWVRVMSRYRGADLLKFKGIDGRELAQDGRCELSVAGRRVGPEGP